MRVLGAMVAVWASGCVAPKVTSTTVPTQRIVLSTIPTMPQGLSGAAGVGFGVRSVLANPDSTPRSGVAYPIPQWELGGLAPFRDGRTSLGGHVHVATAALSHARSANSIPPNPSGVAIEAALELAHDLPLAPTAGLSLAGGLGAMVVPVRTIGGVLNEATPFFPHASGAVGLYGQFGVVRPWIGLSLGTALASDVAGTETLTCQFSCNVLQSGGTALVPLAMAGAGVRLQPDRRVSVALEVLIPLTDAGLRIPVSLGLTLRLGDLRAAPPAPLPPPTPPPPPPAFDEPGYFPL